MCRHGYKGAHSDLGNKAVLMLQLVITYIFLTVNRGINNRRYQQQIGNDYSYKEQIT